MRVLVAEDEQFVLGQHVLDSIAHRIGHRFAKIDVGYLGAEVRADPRDRDASVLRHDGTALETAGRLVHDTILPRSTVVRWLSKQ